VLRGHGFHHCSDHCQAGRYEIHLFHVNYGQKAEKKELEVIEKIGKALEANDLICVDVDLFRNLSALTQK